MLLGKLFPERIFARRLHPGAEKRLRLAQARAEESIVRAHVESALMFVDVLAEDLPFDRAIETYVRVAGIPEPLASTVVTRALVTLGEDLAPDRRRAVVAEPVEEPVRPVLRLDEASDGRLKAMRTA